MGFIPINKDMKLIVYDLALKQSMYRVPEKIIKDIYKNFPVNIEAINCPNLKKTNSDAEIYWGNRIDKDILQKMPKLKWVHFGSVGINRLNNINRQNVIITSSKGLVTESLITHLITLIGLFSRRLDIFFKNQTKPLTRDDYDVYFSELKNFSELNILILGLGEIGKKLAKKLSYLGCSIDSVSRSRKINKYIRNQYNFQDFGKGLNKYDYVISLLPENEKTFKIINYEFLKLLSKDTTFINLGRGKTVDENDLIKALDNSFFKRAILDVTAIEPLPKNSILNNHPKIFLTPHIASFSPSYWPLQEKLFTENLKHFLSNDYEKMINIEYKNI